MTIFKGNRGIVTISEEKGIKVATKEKNPNSTAIARIEIESIFLKKLNKHHIGPKIISFKDDKLKMEYIDGILFEDYIPNSNKPKIMSILKEIINQAYKMDILGISKEEMHNPKKHIIIRDDLPVMIDFERSHHTERPKNITQLIEYIIKLKPKLEEKGFNLDIEILRNFSKKYKKEQTSITNLISLIS